MSAKSVIATVVGFLTHHVADLNNLADALSGITPALPIDSQDKDRIGSVIAEIKASADNIANFLEHTTVTGDGGEVVVKESDLEHAVANYLASDAGKAVIAAAASVHSSAEGNGNA